VNTIGFPLVGGPAGTMEGGRQAEVAKAILGAKNVPYFVAAPMLIQDLNSWEQNGMQGLQSVVLYALPELDGAIDTVTLGGLVRDDIFLIRERVIKLCSRINRWVSLRRKAAKERKVAVLLYGFPPGVGAVGTAALLNVPRSLELVLKELQDAGYDLGEAAADLDGEAIVTALKRQLEDLPTSRGPDAVAEAAQSIAADIGAESVATAVEPHELREWLTYPEDWGPTEWGPIPFLPSKDLLVRKMTSQWGDLESYRGLRTTAKGQPMISGVQLGNVWIGVQPLLGLEGDPMRLLFERDFTPHPQYAATYQWLKHDYQADALVHFGMHGTVEWLPGSPLGNSGYSWSDVLLSDMPNVYIYAANNPSESIVAKRRGYGTIVSHNVPPYSRAGLYKQLATLKELLAEYRDAPEANAALKPTIVDTVRSAGLEKDLPFGPEGTSEAWTAETVDSVDDEVFTGYIERLYQYLQVVEQRLFSEGLHTLGQEPTGAQVASYLSAYFDDKLPASIIDDVSHSHVPAEQVIEAHKAADDLKPLINEAALIRDKLLQTPQEISGMLRALNGEYVLPATGGDLLRDGYDVLPTGRNIHALDPYRMPSAGAWERGSIAAQKIVEQHLAKHDTYPETVAVMLWGLDAIKTRGESLAMALALVGARPEREGTGRIVRFELIPLEELGRPRIDILANLSGIFRDTFPNIVELLDDCMQRAAAAAEPTDMNFVRKHSLEMEEQGLDNATARIFSNPVGDYGSMVNERVGTADWQDTEELGMTWQSRNSFSYGRGSEKGVSRPEVLQTLLKSTDRIVQQIDSVEYGLTDIQEYYANTGAMKAAAETVRGDDQSRVDCTIVEAFGGEPDPRDLEATLRMEYRSKLLNPKWANAMANQGSGGAYEISQRMTAMVGWGGTTGFAEDWTYDQAAQTYALDEEMAEKLRNANPEAFRNVVKRMLEANGRGMWNADPATIERLQALYQETEDKLEGVDL